MKALTTLTLAGAACALVLAIPASAADKTTPAQAKTANSKTAVMRTAWPAETVTGKLSLVDANHKLLVVKSTDGIPFDMLVTPRTRIHAGNQAVTLKDLVRDQDKNVSIKFVPERRGDVAESIRITG